MAVYKYSQVLTHSDHSAFDQIHRPGSPTPHSGIYQCVVCGLSDVSSAFHPLPPQNHHQHEPRQGPIEWRLAVATH